MAARENGQSRQYYRIRYPVDESPEIQIGKRSFPVIDLSLMGVRIGKRGDTEFRKLQKIEGKLRFKNKVVVHIKGKVIRVHRKSVAIALSDGIPGSIIMEEQRLLRNKYRAWE
jgi:hypothetical protein